MSGIRPGWVCMSIFCCRCCDIVFSSYDKAASFQHLILFSLFECSTEYLIEYSNSQRVLVEIIKSKVMILDDCPGTHVSLLSL